MNRGYAAAVLAIVATMSLHGEALSQPPLPSLSCFYECKPGPLVDGEPTFREITTLMVGSSIGDMERYATTSAGSMNGGPVTATLRIYDGNSNLRAVALTELTAGDVDEVNICATLRDAQGGDGSCIPAFDGPCEPDGECCPGLECVGTNGSSQCAPLAVTQGAGPGPGPSVGIPQAGLIRIDLSNDAVPQATTSGDNDGPPPPPPVHVWIKNILGRFVVAEDEPFDGRVIGIAKTQCMVGPPSDRRPRRPDVEAVLVENTADGDGGPPCGSAIAPECMGSCPDGFTCRSNLAVGDATTSGSSECVCRFDD